MTQPVEYFNGLLGEGEVAMRVAAWMVAACVALFAARAAAQTNASGANITLQLPNFTVFGVNTMVLAPDSGPSPLAAERQARYSRAMYGPSNPQRAIGAQRGAAMAAVTAQIHDARADDEAILRAARARRTNWSRGSTSQLDRRGAASSGGLQSIAQIERERALKSAAEEREALALLEKARQAKAAGKSSVAAIYYGMSAKKAAGQLKTQIEGEWRELKAGG
jgi:hypothetical protein